MSGMVTSIQRFSLNDGPGIRTTVFFKGCNLHCAWCHNPETIRLQNDLLAHPEKCIACGHCVAVCPTGAHARVPGGIAFDRTKCTTCGKCAEICFPGAMEMAGRNRTAAEVLAEIEQDAAYYRDSDGGVTLSGGEVFCQPQFAGELIDGCRAAGISVAVETNLCWEFEAMRPMLAKLSLVMFDLKLWDDAAHQRWTGVGNGLVKENIAKLDTLGIPLIARTPLIPGATDDEGNIAAIAKFLAPLKNLQYYELLNFNPLGESKYRALGLENPFEKARPLPAATVEKLRQSAAAAGIQVKVG